MTLMTMMTMTAVSRVRAAQPDAFWLACDRGYDTLFVHGAVLNNLLQRHDMQC